MVNKLIFKEGKRNLPAIPFRWGVILVILLSLGRLTFSLAIRDPELLAMTSSVYKFIEGLVTVATIFYTFNHVRRHDRRMSRAWLFLTVGLLMAFFAGVTWSVYVLILNETPTPSVVDLLYILCYVFLWLGLYNYPLGRQRGSEYKYIWLDNIIVILGSGLVFMVLFYGPLSTLTWNNLSQFKFSMIYPSLDLVLLWSLLTFFRNRPEQSNYPPLLLIGLGLFTVFFGDCYTSYQELVANNINEIFYDLSFSIGYMITTLAGFAQVSAINNPPTRAPATGGHRTSLQSWPVYLPYFWLVISCAAVFINGASPYQRPGYYIALGAVIALVILRQVLTLRENESLFISAQTELCERVQAQDALHQAQIELERRVEERTAELAEANVQMALLNENLTQTNQSLRSEVAERTHLEEEIRHSLYEKEIMLKEIHHRVKNNLQVISSLLSLQSAQIQDPQSIQLFKDSQNRVRSMALIHEKLYQSHDLARIDFKGYVESLSSYLVRSFASEARGVGFQIEVEAIILGIDQAIPCGLIINELVSNSLKYAFPDERKGQVHIRFHQDEKKQFHLVIGDDGIGFPENIDFRNTTSLGLQLVNSLVTQLEGSIELVSSNGKEFRINFCELA